MDSQIELKYLVGYCKQLPTFRDALPIIEAIREWGADNDAITASSLAVREILEYFKLTSNTMGEREQKKLPTPEITTPEMPEFRFFVGVSDNLAPEFKDLLRECIAKLDTDGKKDWFCLYAAWRYYKKEREVGGGFVDFFTDIDALFPGLLKDVRNDLPGNRRLKPYCDMLSYEYKKWAVSDGKLPLMQVWTHEEWVRAYDNKWETIKRMQALVREFFKAFVQLLGTN